MPEPNGCSSYFFGLPIPEGVGLFCLFRANLFGNHQYCYEKLDPSSQGAYRVWVEDNQGPIESNEHLLLIRKSVSQFQELLELRLL